MQHAIPTQSKRILGHRACHQSHLGRIFLLQAKDDHGHAGYYFLRVKPRREALFLTVLKGSHVFDLEAFGEVVESGYGEAVPQDIADRMRLEFGWCG